MTAKSRFSPMKKSKKPVMSADAFKSWRRKLGLSQKEAAKALGLKLRIIQYYEKGQRDGKAIIIPRSVRLACQALMTGILDYDGQTITVLPEGKTLSSALSKDKDRGDERGEERAEDESPGDSDDPHDHADDAAAA